MVIAYGTEQELTEQRLGDALVAEVRRRDELGIVPAGSLGAVQVRCSNPRVQLIALRILHGSPIRDHVELAEPPTVVAVDLLNGTQGTWELAYDASGEHAFGPKAQAA